MKPKTMVLMIVAVACGLVAAILVKQIAAKGPSDNIELILVAATDLKPGDRIDKVEMFEEKEYIKNTAPFGSMTKKDFELKQDKILKKTLVKSLTKGEPITEKHVTDENITVELAPGQRAISIPVRIDNIASGFALPGNRVDLLTKYQSPDNSKIISKIFLQKIKILAVGTDTKKPEGATSMPSATVVTLAVSPKEAAKINWTLASGGQITMALRRPDDDVEVKSADTQVSSLGSGDKDLNDETSETVLIALRDIDKGTDLKGKDLKEWFKEQRVPEGVFGNDVFVKTMTDDALKDAKVGMAIKPGTPVMRVLLGASEPGPGKGKSDTDVAPVQVAEKFVQRIYNGGKDPITTTFQGSGQAWASDRHEPSSPSPMPAPSKEPSDKDTPKSGSEGK